VSGFDTNGWSVRLFDEIVFRRDHRPLSNSPSTKARQLPARMRTQAQFERENADLFPVAGEHTRSLFDEIAEHATRAGAGCFNADHLQHDVCRRNEVNERA